MTALEETLREWVPRQRWFGSKGRTVTALTATELGRLDGEDATLQALLVEVAYDDGHAERYSVPLSLRPQPADGIEAGLVGEIGGLGWAYDAPHDPSAAGLLLEALRSSADAGPLRFRPLLDLPTEAHTRVIGAEQSNTSLVYGEELIVKLFRRVAPGTNPDLELTRALQEAGSPHVAPVHGFVEADLGGEETTLAVAQRFLPGASEGWAMATASVRDLYALASDRGGPGAPPPDPAEAGADFAAESERLGTATAQVHLALAQALPSGTASADDVAAVSARMLERLDEAVEVVPDLAPFADALREAFSAVGRRTAPVPVQRIHGDFHLGQVLRTAEGWVLLDFEGEPARPLAERRRPMSSLRDVAGMLRSYDYAARFLLAERGTAGDGEDDLGYLAAQWAERNRTAFCTGYATAAGSDPREEAELLRAFELDKAVYEIVYEARNRPSWLPIPLGSVARLVGGMT